MSQIPDISGRNCLATYQLINLPTNQPVNISTYQPINLSTNQPNPYLCNPLKKKFYYVIYLVSSK
jgi:hypothetical protein